MTSKRRTIPISVRYQVLCKQADPETVERIERSGGTLKRRYSLVLAIARCRISGERLIEHGCEFDHINPKYFDGPDTPENLQALIPRVHRRKTDSDIAAIAKTKSIIRKREKTWKPNRKKIQSRGFNKTLSKKFNGEVVARRNDNE